MEFHSLSFWQIFIIAFVCEIAQLSYGNMEDEYAHEEDYHSSENENDSVLILEHVGNQGGSILIPQNNTRSVRRATFSLKMSATSTEDETNNERTSQSSNSLETDKYLRELQNKQQQKESYKKRLAELQAKQLETKRFRKITEFPRFPKYPKEPFSAEGSLKVNQYPHGDVYPTWRPLNSKRRNVFGTEVTSTEAVPLQEEADEAESTSEKNEVKREALFQDYPDTAIIGEDDHAGNYENPFNPSEFTKPTKPKKPCNKTKELPPESEENPELITGAEPVDGPRGKPLHGPTELLRRSYQPYFTCGRNTDAGIQSCRQLCDIRDRQHITCLEDFCYCQTSYTFHNPANFEPSDTAPFFLCGRYTLEGYEKCVEECKRKPLATVQCGGPTCYCHYASSPLKSKDNQVSEEVESRSILEKPPNRIRASYCGRAPSEPIAKPGQTLSHPDVNDKVNNCKYRCKGGMFSCNKRFCYCVSSGRTSGA